MSDTKVATRPYIIGPASTSFVVPAATGPVSITNIQSAKKEATAGTAWDFGTNAQTFTAGVAVVGIYNDVDGTSMSMTIKGQPATPVMTPSGWIQTFYATVTAGTGTISVTTTGSVTTSVIAMCMIEGGSGLPSDFDSAFAASVPSGTPCLTYAGVLTVPTNGVGLAWLGDVNATHTGTLPITWSGTDSGTESASTFTGAGIGAGTCMVSMSKKTTSGTMTASGTSPTTMAGAYGMCSAWGP